MAKIFSSFDLGSVQISFVGMMGEFAVWAIEDMLTGEIQYIVDDRKGSLRYLFIYLFIFGLVMLGITYYWMATINQMAGS